MNTPTLIEIGTPWSKTRRPPDNSGRSDFGVVPPDKFLLIDHVSVELISSGNVDADSFVLFKFSGGSASAMFPIRPLVTNGKNFLRLKSFGTPVIFRPGNPISTDVFANNFPAGVTLDFPKTSGVTLQGRLVGASGND